MKPKYCSKCGKELNPDGTCNCSGEKESRQTSVLRRFVSKVFGRMGVGSDSEQEAQNVFEREKKIVPDLITQNDAEIPIKQYDIAKLRSRIMCKYAEGRLQITNKRVIFRAAGTSPSGKITLHHEFSVEELAGVEIKKTTRGSFLNIILGIILTLIITNPFYSMFNSFNRASTLAATIFGYLLIVVFVAPFFLIKKRFWLKLCSVSAAFGVSAGLSDLTSKAVDYMLGRSLFDITDTISTVILFIWIFNMVLVCLVPELRFGIKTKSGSDAIQIRRKIFGWIYNPTEYTDFAEVLPWKDTDKAIEEIGTIIDDIQTMGDLAIDKWKEN